MTQILEFPRTREEGYLALPWTWNDQWSIEDGCFLVTVAELPDFFAAGVTKVEAYRNAREALQSHIAGYLATGTEIPVPDPAEPQSLVRFG